MGFEDFTLYTEVDIAEDRIQKTANHIDHYVCRGEATYVYKDFGVDYFHNFVHKIKFKAEALTPINNGSVWLLADAVDVLDGLYQKSLFLMTYGSELYIEEYVGGVANNNHTTISPNTWYYAKIEKRGTDLSCKLYKDPECSTVVDMLNLNLGADHKFRYLYPCNTKSTNPGHCDNHDIENFELIVSQTSSDTGSGTDAVSEIRNEVKSSDVGVGIDEWEGDFWLKLVLKLQQEKKLNITLSQIGGRSRMSKRYYQGETMFQSVEVRDISGSLIDPNTIVITIIGPGGAGIDEQAMTKDGTGKYHYDFLLATDAAVGKWRTEIKAESGFIQIEQDEFTVMEAI